MIITLKTEGGFAYIPALARPRVLDTSLLPPDEARELEALIEAIGFFTLPSVLSESEHGAADFLTYEVTVDAGDRLHSVRTVDPIRDSRFAELVRRVEKSTAS